MSSRVEHSLVRIVCFFIFIFKRPYDYDQSDYKKDHENQLHSVSITYLKFYKIKSFILRKQSIRST